MLKIEILLSNLYTTKIKVNPDDGTVRAETCRKYKTVL